MNYKNIIGLAAGIIIAASIFAPASAERMRLDQLKRADEVALQRGQSIQDGACAMAIIKEIDAYGGKQSMRDFTIDVKSSPIVIEDKKGKLKHECKNGVHTTIDHGRKLVIQKYNEEGEPTMMEP